MDSTAAPPPLFSSQHCHQLEIERVGVLSRRPLARRARERRRLSNLQTNATHPLAMLHSHARVTRARPTPYALRPTPYAHAHASR